MGKKNKLKKARKKIDVLQEQYAALHSMLQMTTENMRNIQQELYSSKDILLSRNQYIQDSINYALRIQKSLFQSEEKIKTKLGKSFILYRPKDVVCGDFYWTYVSKEATYVAAVDCTGHGIPGAMLTVLGVTTLNNIIKEEPEISLKELVILFDERIKKSLNFNEENTGISDGMDLAIIKITSDKSKLHYTGVKRPLYLIRENELTKYRGNRFCIGDTHFEHQKVEEIEVELKPKDKIYLFSDGFPDQFSDVDQKYTVGKFKDLLLSLNTFSMEEQKIKLEEELLDWKGKQSQTDDVLIIGFEV